MAQLIHFKTRPQKHLALLENRMLPLNKAISREEQHKQQDFVVNVLKLKEEKAFLIGEFISNRSLIYDEALRCGQSFSIRRMAADIITLYYYWQKNITNEADSMIILSKKIAQTVLNNQILNHDNAEERRTITDELSKYFSIKLLLPAQDFHAFQLSLSNLAHYFEGLSFLTVELHDKSAQLKIYWQNEERAVALKNIDIPWLLARAIKNINRMNKNQRS